MPDLTPPERYNSAFQSSFHEAHRERHALLRFVIVQGTAEMADANDCLERKPPGERKESFG